MPAIAMRTSPVAFHRRLLIGVLAFVLLCSYGAAVATPVEARNWTREIAATRASQIYYENAMRAADSEVRSLSRARKQTQRTLRKVRVNLRAAIARRGETKRQLQATRAQLGVARASLTAASFETPPPPDTATAILALTGPEDDQAEPERALVLASDRGLGIPAVSAIQVAQPLRTEATVGDVLTIERQLTKQQRAFGKARQRAQRVARAARIKGRSLAAIKARQRSATARREGAEAALGSRILAMSQLAQRRVAKKTKVRPGVNSGFTWPTRGRLSQGYGCTGYRLNPPRGSCRHFHDGIDVSGYRGTAIRAAAVGVVSYIGWNPWDQEGRAFMIVVAHPGGYETLYGHALPSRQVRVGQLVRRGQVIGYMGSTGRSTGVHLHFELRRGRTTLNPLAFL